MLLIGCDTTFVASLIYGFSAVGFSPHVPIYKAQPAHYVLLVLFVASVPVNAMRPLSKQVRMTRPKAFVAPFDMGPTLSRAA